MFLDELKYLLSATTCEALGIVRSFRCHILLSHQSLGDLKEMPGVDPEKVRGAVVDNTNLKLIYRFSDFELAKEIAGLTGQRKAFVESRPQSIQSQDVPEARWNEVYVDRVQAGLITSLPVPEKGADRPPVGVVIGLDDAEIFHTSFLVANGSAPQPKVAPESLVATCPQSNPIEELI